MKKLNEGYCVRQIHWPSSFYIYIADDDVCYNEKGLQVSSYRLEQEKVRQFELFYEEEVSEKMEESGSVEDGEHPSKLKVRENESTKTIRNTTNEIEKEYDESNESTTLQIKKDTTRNLDDGEKLTKIEKMKISASSMPEIEMSNERRLMPIEEKEIQPSDSTLLSRELKKEKSSSLMLLNNSTNQLVELANQLTQKKKNEKGEELLTPTHNIEIAVKCLTEARNTMKAKLDYLKLANEIGK